MVIVAPTYNGYRHTLITAIQGSKLPFPVEVRAEALGREEKRERDATIVDQMVGGIMGNKRTYSVIVFPTANDDSEMITLIQKALRSGSTRAIITSLIAKSNEANGRPSPDSTENGHAGHESTPDASDDGLDSDE